MLLIRLLYFEVCSDALLCLYPLLHRLEGEGFLTDTIVVLYGEPSASSIILIIFSFWFIELNKRLELADEEVGVVGELFVTRSDQPLPLF